MLQIKEIERKRYFENGKFHSEVEAVHVNCPDCIKVAVIVTLPPAGKDLTIVCKDCLGSVELSACQLATFRLPIECFFHNSYTAEWLCS